MIRSCNVCVIGGAGFLGSHLVQHLIEERDCSVVVLDNLITGRKEWLPKQAKFHWCDITHSENELRKIFESFNIDYVFNYAAMPYIPVSFQRPLFTFDVNARGAIHVINAAHSAKVKGILQVSSAEIYGEATGLISESAETKPHSTYGASKLAIDMYVQARWREAQVPCIALRQFNCVGERETHPYVIPEIIRQVGKSSSIKLGNNSERDFIYAGDAVAMAVELLERGKHGEVYNLGSEQCIKIYELAVLIGDIMGKQVKVVNDKTRERPWEIWHLQSDNSKLYSTIERRPKLSLVDALKRTIDYHSQYGWVF